MFLLYVPLKFVARGGGNTGNKQSQLVIATLLRDKLQENVARIAWPLRTKNVNKMEFE